MARSQRVEFQQQFLVRAFRITLAIVKRILLALFRAREIQIAAQPVGNGKIGLQDAAQHLLVQILLKALGIAQDGVRVRVFGVEVSNDLGIILVAEPCVIVDEPVPMDDTFHRLTPRNGGLRRAGALGIGCKAGGS